MESTVNFKRNEFVALTGMTLANMKNYERTDRSFMPQPEESEPVIEGSVRRFTPLQVLKTVLMNQLVEEYGMNIGKAFGLVEFAGKELAALAGKIVESSSDRPVFLAFHFSRDASGNRSVHIFGGYPAQVFDTLQLRIREDAAEQEDRSGPCCILNVTDAFSSILDAAEKYSIRFELT